MTGSELPLPSYAHDVKLPSGWTATIYPDGSVDVDCADWTECVSLTAADVAYVNASVEHQRGLWWEAAAGEWGQYMSPWSDQ